MKIGFKSISFLSLFMALACLAQAKPPLEVIYADKVTTSFKWHWPYQTRRVTNYVQIKPYYYTGRLIRVAGENISKYRFYYTNRTCKNDWGYYFHPGDKLCPRQIVSFGPLQPENKISSYIYPR